MIINVHGSHLHDLYGACESEIDGNIYVNAFDAELDTRGIQYSLLPLSDRDGGSIFVAQSSSCKSVIVNIDGESMYQVDLSSLYIEKHEILNITRSPSIRKGIYGDRRYCKTKNKVILNIDNISVDSPQIQFFSNINLNG